MQKNKMIDLDKVVEYTTIRNLKLVLEKGKASYQKVYGEKNSNVDRSQIIPMTEDECKNGCEALSIEYEWLDTQFGKALVASTSKGICWLEFVGDREPTLKNLMGEYPKASIGQGRSDSMISLPIPSSDKKKIKLHVRGTAFQQQVWNALLKIPSGHLVSYGTISSAIGNPKANRAVGTAIGSNPVSYFIPCHRVLQNSAHLGGYRWGSNVKQQLIGWEIADSE